MDLHYFNTQPFVAAIKTFFAQLNVPINYFDENPTTAFELPVNKYNPNNPAHKMITDIYVLGMVDDTAFDKTSGRDVAYNVSTYNVFTLNTCNVSIIIKK